jgi:hypothetical protein
VIVIQLTRACLWKALFRHDQAPIELPHWNEETLHALRLVYRIVGLSWMRRGDASANHQTGKVVGGLYGHSGSSMSTGSFCPRICAARGSAAAYWRWRKTHGARLVSFTGVHEVQRNTPSFLRHSID